MADLPAIADDEDWEDLSPPGTLGSILPDAQIRLSIAGRSDRKARRAVALLTLRNAARDWVVEHGPRFRAQIGGAAADRIRIIPDAPGGRFEYIECRGGTVRLNLGPVNAWPNETRPPVAVSWRADGNGSLIVTLPAGFARATAAASPAPTAVVTTQPPRSEALWAATPAPAAARMTVTAAIAGDPPPGRSALDQRRGAR